MKKILFFMAIILFMIVANIYSPVQGWDSLSSADVITAGQVASNMGKQTSEAVANSRVMQMRSGNNYSFNNYMLGTGPGPIDNTVPMGNYYAEDAATTPISLMIATPIGPAPATPINISGFASQAEENTSNDIEEAINLPANIVTDSSPITMNNQMDNQTGNILHLSAD